MAKLIAVALCVLALGLNIGAQDATPEAPPPDYLVICADDFAEAAADWAAWRGAHGRNAEVLKLSGIKPEPPTLDEIREAVRARAGDPPREGFQVLLIGDCPVEGTTGYNPKVEIPWLLTTQLDSNVNPERRQRVPTDNYLADLVADPDNKPDIAVGRIPARTPAQVRAALDKVKAYETAKAGDWMRNLTFFAGEGRFGPQIDAMLEGLFTQFAERTISQHYNLRMTYANIRSNYAYAPSRFSAKVIEEANAGALLLTYMGHGSWDRLDDMYVQVEGKRLRHPILTGDDVKAFNITEGRLPVMLIVACDTGFMDHKGECLAERVVFTPNAPVAVLASSRNSHPYANTLLQKAFIAELTTRRVATLGEAMMNAKRELVEAKDPDRPQLDAMAMLIIPKKDRDELNRSHISMYNLTGDPGLRLRHPGVPAEMNPPHEPATGVRPGGTFKTWLKSGVLDEAASWTLEVHARRTAILGNLHVVRAADLASPDAAVRKAMEDSIADNHAVANNKVVRSITAKARLVGTDATHGRQSWEIEWSVDENIAPGNYLLKALAVDKNGAACGFTSVEITVNEAPASEE